MSGSLTQLSAIGAQDTYLSIAPESTHFKAMFRRCTNFSREPIEQQFNSPALFGSKAVCPLSRSGDLATDVYLFAMLDPLQAKWKKSSAHAALLAAGATLDDPALNDGIIYDPNNTIIAVDANDAVRYCDSVGHAMLERIVLEIGGHPFDTHYGEYLAIWEELSAKPAKELRHSIGKSEVSDELSDWARDTQYLYVPMGFWFNRALSQALPLIALQYHEVRFAVNFRKRDELIVIDPEWADLGIAPYTTAPNVNPNANKAARTGWCVDEASLNLNRREGLEALFLVEFVYLDTIERRLFAAQTHEYLMDQLQFSGVETIKAKSSHYSYAMNFNHPTREIIWALRDTTRVSNPVYIPQGYDGNDPTEAGIQNTGKPYIGGNNHFDFSGFHSPHDDSFFEAILQLNGNARFQKRHSTYFRLVQPYQHHTRIPSKHIYCYCFALEPEDWKPTGSINFSRIDNVTFRFVFHYSGNNRGLPHDVELFFFGRSINVVKMVTGMAGTKYAN